ncbi:MAG: hypothetical protein FWF43_08905 [Propionibacteriaceae bacterium]|nr:hypothetical protein [Propionibacteriaceae bacterium]
MKALVDTSVLISGNFQLSSTYELAVASLSYAELHFGASLPTLSPSQSAYRRTHVMRLTERFGPGLPFDDQASISYGILTEVVLRANRQVRRRTMDLLIASVAHSQGAALITENGSDFIPLSVVIPILTPDGSPWT